MKRRICIALALMIALMLSVCAIEDEFENVILPQDVEEEMPVISIENVDDEVGEAKEADLDDLPEEDAIEEQLMIEEKSEGEDLGRKRQKSKRPLSWSSLRRRNPWKSLRRKKSPRRSLLLRNLSPMR